MTYILIIILLLLGAVATIFFVPKIANPTRIYVRACLAAGFVFVFWFFSLNQNIDIKIFFSIIIPGSVIYDYFDWKKSLADKAKY